MNAKQTPKKTERVAKEEEILQMWSNKDIFSKTLQKESPAGEFVFYEGPPTANGRPGIHHLESRAFKDIIPRYKTMRGYHVRRKGGWDTHGLPVEIEVEKELGISSKKEIEEYGIAQFNEKCKENVWKYVDEWTEFTKRIGYWMDLNDPYVTYYPSYMETLWWIVGEIDKKGYLYKDYKVLPWCARCGTALSSHELAQGYEDVKDLSVTAEFNVVEGSHELLSSDIRTAILAWTTTPWTLPGNVALAVGSDIEYVVVEKDDEDGSGRVRFVLAKDLLENIFEDSSYDVVGTLKGSEVAGTTYEPLYPYLKDIIVDEQKEALEERAYRVYEADFVTTEDGTGIVHTAVMYGQDDFELGTNVGLPKQHLINESGHFLSGTDFLEGKFVKDEETDISIIKDLAHRGLLFSKKKYEHSYPHCWRCKTPLIYFARDSWYVRMSELKDKLISANQKVNWHPEHIKEGRFGEWLSGIKDWAISRERYWGTPLPVWMNEDGTERIVVDSLETLKKHTKKSGNKYFVIRHGEAESNVERIVSDKKENPHHLTENGIEQVKESAKNLKEKGVDVIISSPFVRTKETAEIVADAVGISRGNIVYDERIQEIQTGFNLKPFDEFHNLFHSEADHFHVKVDGGETLTDVKKRVGEFLYDIDTKYEGKTILVVTHASPSWMLFAAAAGATEKELTSDTGSLMSHLSAYLKNAEVKEMDFVPLPHNDNYERDLHRPYVDDVVLYSDKGTELRRVKEVMDVWFDSGAMPYAQDHYPFENKEWVEKAGVPADYISEGIDQTRGWFYTLHAIATLLGREEAYKNVISLGLILDAEGKKMSKSKGNSVNPFEMIDKYGVDTLRMWMYSVNQPGDSKNFDEKTVDEVSKKVLNLLENVVSFYEMYKTDDQSSEIGAHKSTHVMDRWIVARLSKTEEVVRTNLDEYRVMEASREIRELIGDLSQWYVRRSRDRFKSDDEKEKEEAVSTTRFVLYNLSKIIAPFMPFLGESVYASVGGVQESVHLDVWPELSKYADEELLSDMYRTREVSSWGLEARSRADVPVRQPLSSVTVKSEELSGDFVDVIKEELNVKEVVFDDSQEESAVLDLEITSELRNEGYVRELLRFIQNMRKEKGLDPQDDIDTLSISGEDIDFLKDFQAEIAQAVRAKEITFSESGEGEEITLGENTLNISI